MSHGPAHAHSHEHSHLAELLDLDVAVLHDYHQEVISCVASAVPAKAHLIDLGAGTGAGAIALAQALPDATVTAVDASPDMLERLRARADEHGVGDRIRTVAADLDQPWPDLDPADLVWASASLHHVADPARVLGLILAGLRPGGRLALTELDSFPLFLAGAGGTEAALEERCHAAMTQIRAEAGMHIGDDWADRLLTAGFAVQAERRFDIALNPPLPPLAGRYAHISLARMVHGLADRLEPADLAALEALAHSVPDREDLTIRAQRLVWLASRAS
jgi:ubiquinone/menaquinone biosynthesis C-methylase UbiE